MLYHVLRDEAAVAAAAARRIAEAARRAAGSRGRFLMAVSGGKTPWAMLKDLASEDVPWAAVHVFQVDERFAADGDPDRNLTHLHASLLGNAPIPPGNIHAMPVTAADPENGARDYERILTAWGGDPPVLDLVHLGLGADGHTASLVPGDPALECRDRDVAICGVYQNRRRMTLTFPLLDRAREILWLATGASKAPMIARLLAGDALIPAGRVSQAHAVLLIDAAAASGSVTA
ncbi:MAG: 6-phosphogluconolactonase [Planctomycetes bacterium]|nr:6-phosphogluconolactonase [Planctomycetota bacterium]